ncbi:tellurite resistance TerB C-terminal domain-containing protein [Saccharospirillum impatiens]|uniref:tellurite resistance TerB family protein n=1 Tax=Saccharospirillum impatiens TaxID=169438 RepID=UPI00146B0580|nr:tellurite resistance TerB C-terminal domain-containing protein [Saccharospirillum impatiens]
MITATGSDQEKGAIVSKEALGGVFGEQFDARLTQKQRHTLARALNTLGYCLVPDPEHKNPVPAANEGYGVFRGSRVPQLSAGGQIAYVGIRLGYMVASADGVDEDEVTIIDKLAGTLSDDDERRFMEVFAKWVKASGSGSKAGLKDQIDKLPLIPRKAIFDGLADVALADGELSKKELTQLTSMHKTLGLGDFNIEEHRGLAEAPTASTKKAKSTAKSDGVEQKAPPARVVLDAEKLAAIKESTKGTHTLLGEIFNDDEDNDAVAGTNPATVDDERTPASDVGGGLVPWHHGALNAAQEAIFDTLVQHEEWEMAAVEKLIKDSGLMVAGTIEAINDAAIDQYGEAVLEEAESTLFVYSDIVESAW